jgi:hypothetical protein
MLAEENFSNPEPRTLCIDDMIKVVNDLDKDNSNYTILMKDANENINDSKGGLSKLTQSTNLLDTFTHFAHEECNILQLIVIIIITDIPCHGLVGNQHINGNTSTVLFVVLVNLEGSNCSLYSITHWNAFFVRHFDGMTKKSIAINRLLSPYLTTVFIIWWLIIVDELFGISVPTFTKML